MPTVSNWLAAPLLALHALGCAAGVALEWQPVVEIDRGAGVRGAWQQNDSRYDFVDDPTVALAADGSAAVAWVDQAARSVRFQRFTADGGALLPAPVDVSRRPATFSWLPRLALAPDDPQRIHVLWQEIIFSGGSHGGDMLVARSEDGGRTFSEPINLSRSLSGDGKGRLSRDLWHNGSFDLMAAPGGVVHAAWTDYEGTLWLARSDDAGRRFTPPRAVETGTGLPARAPALATAPDGTAYLAWTVGEDASADIRFLVLHENGRRFGEVIRPSPGAGRADAPKLAVDAAGVVHLVHAEHEGGPSGLGRIRHLRPIDGGRSFEQTVAALRPPAGTWGLSYPSLALGRPGEVHVLAEVQPGPGQAPRGLVLAHSVDGGRSFTAPALVPASADPAGGSNGSSQGLLMDKLAAGPQGALAVVNSSLRPGVGSRVWLMRARFGQRP